MWHHRKACGDATKFLFDKLYVYIRSSFATGNQERFWNLVELVTEKSG